VNFEVFWKPKAEADLAALWTSASDRSAITAAANTLDETLRRNPLSAGESRSGDTRILIVPPLVVVFRVFEEDQKVWIVTVRRSRRSRTDDE